MTFALKRKALTLFKNKSVDKSIVRHNVVQWLKAMEHLGENWILSKQVKRKKIVRSRKPKNVKA